MYKIVDRKVDGFLTPQLEVDRSIRDFVKPLIPVARQIVIWLQRAAGVDDVAYGQWLGRSRSTEKLAASLRPAEGYWAGHKLVYVKTYPWHDIVGSMEPYVGQCGDVPSSRVLRLVDQMRDVRVPYRCVPYWGWAEPATWQVPHVWPGFYLDEPLSPAYYRLDPVSGIGLWRNYIWRTAPLGMYAMERFCVPLDAWIKQQVGSAVIYRRIAGNLYFVVAAESLESAIQAIRNVLDPLPIDYYVASTTDYMPGIDIPGL